MGCGQFLDLMSKDVEFSKKSARPPVLSYTNSIPLIVDKLLTVAHKSNAIGASPLVLILRYLWNVVENSPLYNEKKVPAPWYYYLSCQPVSAAVSEQELKNTGCQPPGTKL